jgi:hypothetical protein
VAAGAAAAEAADLPVPALSLLLPSASESFMALSSLHVALSKRDIERELYAFYK